MDSTTPIGDVIDLFRRRAYRTTEFWVSVAGLLILVLNAAFGWDIQIESIIGIVTLVSTFVLGRTATKRSALSATVFAVPVSEAAPQPPPVNG